VTLLLCAVVEDLYLLKVEEGLYLLRAEVTLRLRVVAGTSLPLLKFGTRLGPNQVAVVVSTIRVL
jgi:hypothetical protein